MFLAVDWADWAICIRYTARNGGFQLRWGQNGPIIIGIIRSKRVMILGILPRASLKGDFFLYRALVGVATGLGASSHSTCFGAPSCSTCSPAFSIGPWWRLWASSTSVAGMVSSSCDCESGKVGWGDVGDGLAPGQLSKHEISPSASSFAFCSSAACLSDSSSNFSSCCRRARAACSS